MYHIAYMSGSHSEINESSLTVCHCVSESYTFIIGTAGPISNGAEKGTNNQNGGLSLKYIFVYSYMG